MQIPIGLLVLNLIFMAYTPLAAADTWPTSRNTINTNFGSVDTQLAAKVAYSSTVPAIGDLVVAASTDWLSIKKKVFTASQVLESDSNWQPTSAAKGTAYNKNYGTSSGTTLEGSNDALYMKLAGTQTVTGDKTFSGALTIPSATVATTQSPWDSSTKVATTAFVSTAVGTGIIYKNGTTTKNAADASTTQTIAHGIGFTPKFVRIEMSTNTPWFFAKATYNGTTQSSQSYYLNNNTVTNDTTFRINVNTAGTPTYNTGVITVDATNITITWTRTDTLSSGTYQLLWEANN